MQIPRRVLLMPSGTYCEIAMKPLRILVCGTNYDGSYLQAIRLKPRVYELAGT